MILRIECLEGWTNAGWQRLAVSLGDELRVGFTLLDLLVSSQEHDFEELLECNAYALFVLSLASASMEGFISEVIEILGATKSPLFSLVKTVEWKDAEDYEWNRAEVSR